MLRKESLKKYIEELIKEVETELDEMNVTGNVDGYQTPHAFSRKSDNQRRKKTATQMGYSIVDNDVENIDESELKGYLAADVVDDIVKSIGSKFVSGQIKNTPNRNYIYLKLTDIKFGSGVVKMLKSQFGIDAKVDYFGGKGKIGSIPSVVFLSNKVISEAGLNGYESVNEAELKPKKLTQLKKGEKFVFNDKPYEFIELYTDLPNAARVKQQDGKTSVVSFGGGMINKNTKGGFSNYLKQGGRVWDNVNPSDSQSIDEGKVKRPVNRWLELKNDESMHANKKLAVGLKELKYQLAEVEKFFSWYNKIKNINELDSDNYWKRTNSHIYKIKERIINIAKTLQEIEK